MGAFYYAGKKSFGYRNISQLKETNILLSTFTKELLFSGYCHFENGLCGLTSENSTEFQWSADSGKTPSENTGPAFDHTTFADKGTCMSIHDLTFL